jgi:hypothetical protein
MEMRVECGTTLQRTDTAQRRIVGGDEAGFGTFPWQVTNTKTNQIAIFFLLFFILKMKEITFEILN